MNILIIFLYTTAITYIYNEKLTEGIFNIIETSVYPVPYIKYWNSSTIISFEFL